MTAPWGPNRRVRLGLAIVPGVIALVTLAGAAWGQESPYLTGRVTDAAGMIDEETRASLEALLASFERETGSQVVVLTLESLGGEQIEEVALRVAQTAAIGRGSADDGILLLVARDERALRIEVGYGLEGALTDAESRRILDRIVVPRFREGRFGQGVADGVTAILSEVRGEAAVPAAPPGARPSERGHGWQVATALFLVMVLVLVLVLWSAHHVGPGRMWSSRSGLGVWDWERRVARPSRRARRRSSSARRSGRSWGRSSGGFRGGGGSFGGGGASSSW